MQQRRRKIIPLEKKEAQPTENTAEPSKQGNAAICRASACARRTRSYKSTMLLQKSTGCTVLELTLLAGQNGQAQISSPPKRTAGLAGQPSAHSLDGFSRSNLAAQPISPQLAVSRACTAEASRKLWPNSARERVQKYFLPLSRIL
jgi:hypothetical protein